MRTCAPGMIYFNPRSREGSDWEGIKAIFAPVIISILAPARGATGWMWHSDTYAYYISILAPARGATILGVT